MSDDAGKTLRDLLSNRIFTDSENERILKALHDAGADKPCPRCGHVEFSLQDGYFVHSIQRNLKTVTIGGGRAVPAVVVICERCGWIAEHALGSLGLLPAGE